LHLNFVDFKVHRNLHSATNVMDCTLRAFSVCIELSDKGRTQYIFGKKWNI